MAKAILVYWNTGSEEQEIALSSSGIWYFRGKIRTRFGRQWTKWVKMENHPVIPKFIIGCNDMRIEYNPDDNTYLEVGFRLFRIYQETPKYRLPL